MADERRTEHGVSSLQTDMAVRADDVDTLIGLGLAGEVSSPVRGALLRLAAERDQLRGQVASLERRLAEVELLADRDPLTPVLNRRAFVRELERVVAFCARYQAPASLVVFDLDAFKAVNDTQGHAAGDAALTTVARRLLDNVRASDVVGRLGGDEFAVILAQAEQGAAETKAASLVDRLEARPVAHEGQAIAIRLSAGVRAYSPGVDAAEWLAQADAAMFLRKGERRDLR